MTELVATETPAVAAIRSAITGKATAREQGAALVRLGPTVDALADAVEAGVIAVEVLTDDAGLRSEREQVLALLRDRRRRAAVAAALARLDANVGIGVIAIGTDDPEAAVEALRAQKPLDVVLTRPGDGYYVPDTRTESVQVSIVGEDGEVEIVVEDVEMEYERLVHDVIEERLSDGDDDRFVIHDGHLFAIGFRSDEVQAALVASRRA